MYYKEKNSKKGLYKLNSAPQLFPVVPESRETKRTVRENLTIPHNVLTRR